MKSTNFKKWMESLALKGDYRGNIFQRLVAAKYMMAPALDPDSIYAFRDLARKIARQKEFLDSGYEMISTSEDPYPSMKAMTRDIERQRSMGVKKPVIPTYSEPPSMDGKESGGHPIYSNEENTTQRYVHDIIAHYFGKHSFSARGEYAAYNRHLKTLCNPEQVKSGKCPAAKAMFTEVVAQTSCYYVYGRFVDQKAVILHDFDHANVGLLAPFSALNRFFEVSGKIMSLREDFDWDEFKKLNENLAYELEKQGKGSPLVKLEPISPSEM